MAAWTAVGLFAFGLSCWGTVAVAVRSADQEAAPGAFVTPVFAVANLGTMELTALLEFEAPVGWQILGAQDSLLVSPGEEGSVFATIVIPSNTPAGDYELALSVVSESDPSDRSTAFARIRVEPTSIVELTGPIGSSAGPGSTVEYDLILANRGTVQDSIVVTAASSRPLDVELSPSVFDLAPQETAAIRIVLRVPITAESGQDVLTVTAVSMLYDGVEDEAVVFTTILPPTPDAVRGTAMEILPGRLRLTLDKDVFTGTLGSRLTFSTSGRVLNGFFSSFVGTTDPFGPDPFEVTSYSILYRREPAMTRLGNVSTRLTDLVSISCVGGSFDIDEELFDLVVVGGVNDDEARFGGRFALGPEVANVGLAYFEARDEMSRQAIVSATAEAEPIEDWRILAEAALGTDDGISSRAFLFGTEIDVAGYFLAGEVFSVGTDFPGSGRDSAGIQLSQRLRMTDLSLSLSLSHEWDNVVRNPLLPTVIGDQLGFNIRANPIEDGPTLTSTTEFGWRRENDPTQMSDVDLLLAMGLRETSGVFPYTFSGEISDRIDLALGTHNRTLTFSEGAGLSVDSFYLFLQLTQKKHVDVISDLVLSGETDVSILFRPEGTLHEASISLRNTLDSFSLSASLFIRFLEGLDIVFDGSIAWDRADASPISFGWGVTFNMDLNVPLPFLVTKGRIEGRLFVDADGDGVYGGADRPIGGAIVEANGSAVSTAEDGLFRFPPLRQGTYSVDIRETPLDAASPAPIAVQVTAGELTMVPIPLAPILTVDGVVFEDLDLDGSAGINEGGFADVRVLLVREDGAVFSALTDATGAFSFIDVLPGEYTASLDPATLPARFAFTTKESIVVEPTAASPSVIAFGGHIRPRPVIVAVQPPTADFSVSPEEPIAREPATFDASLSLDFDGEIASYAWDLDGDGEEDATVPIVEWTFPTPGAYEVSLTVTDDTGNEDTLTRTVNVAGTGPTTDVIIVSSIQPPIAGFTFSPEAPAPGEAVAFDGTLSVDFDGEITAYEWDLDGDGVTDATGPTTLRVFSATGSYDVHLRVTDDGRNKDTIVQTVVVASKPAKPVDVRPTLQPPTADFSYTPGQPVDGEPVTFDASPSSDPDGQIDSYAWDFDGDGVVDSTDPIVGHVFPTPGTYAVRLTVLDDDDAADTATYEVPVGDSSAVEDVDGTILPPIADFIYAPEAPVAGEPVEFNGLVSFDFDGEVVEFEWDFDSNGVTDASGSIVLHVFAASGTYKTRLTVTDNDGATDTIVRSIEVE